MIYHRNLDNFLLTLISLALPSATSISEYQKKNIIAASHCPTTKCKISNDCSKLPFLFFLRSAQQILAMEAEFRSSRTNPALINILAKFFQHLHHILL